MKRRITFYIGFTSLITTAILAVSLALALIAQDSGRSFALVSAHKIFKEVAKGVTEEINHFFISLGNTAETAASAPDIGNPEIRGDYGHPRINYLVNLLNLNADLASVYIGFENGDFIQVLSAQNVPRFYAAYKASPDVTHITRLIYTDAGRMVQEWRFYDDTGNLLEMRTDANQSGYDPRKRPWYIEAKKNRGLIYSTPHVFASSQLPGFTCAVPLPDATAVLGADVTIHRLQTLLRRYSVSENSKIFLADAGSRVIAHPAINTALSVTRDGKQELEFLDAKDADDPLLRKAPEYLSKAIGVHDPMTFEFLGENYLAMALDIGIHMPIRLFTVIVAPVSDFTAFLSRMLNQSLVSTLIIVVVVTGFGLIASRRLSRSLKRVADDAKRAESLDFSDGPGYDSRIKEVYVLIKSLALMRGTIREYMREIVTTTAAKERFESELRIANRIQMDMLPGPPPRQGLWLAVDLSARITPAKEVGGDLYDYFPASAGKICFLVGDVSGKGVPAALFMAQCKALVRGIMQGGDDPGTVLSRVHAELAEGNDECMFVTMFLGVLDTASGEILFADAGHNPAYILTGEDEVTAVPSARGIPLGLDNPFTYSTNRLALHPGESLLLYTDGVTEAQNAKGEFFGNERLTALLGGRPGGSAAAVADAVFAAVETFEDGIGHADDITILVVKYLGGGQTQADTAG